MVTKNKSKKIATQPLKPKAMKINQLNKYKPLWVIIFSATCISCTQVDEITPRSYAGMIIGETQSNREELSRSLSIGEAIKISGELKINPTKDKRLQMPVDFGWITKEGSIIIQSKKYDVLLIQEPTISDGSVTWTCISYPKDAAPNFCRPKSHAR